MGKLYKTFTTQMDTSYTDMVKAHEESLNNFVLTGRFLSNNRLGKLKDPGIPTPMVIHRTDSTMVYFNSQLMYTSIVCCESAAEEKMEGEDYK